MNPLQTLRGTAMGARCSLVINGRSVRVSTGDTPLEAALAEGMIAPLQVPQTGQVADQGSTAPSGRRHSARRARAEALRPSLPGAPIQGQEEAPPPPSPSARAPSRRSVGSVPASSRSWQT
ncbi:hypothetical protein ACRAWG_27265 [Methylobacterium sp. P31]